MSPHLLWLFEEQQCDYVIIACNTAGVAATKDFIKLHPEYQSRIINIVDATLNYLHTLESCEMLVLATQGTINHGVYTSLPDHIVTGVAMPGLVDLIESGDVAGAEAMVYDALLYHPRIHTVLLACTHYAYLAQALQSAFPQYQFITQDVCLHKALEQLLQKTTSDETGSSTYYVSGDPSVYTERFGKDVIQRD